jgi:hypothetical protein
MQSSRKGRSAPSHSLTKSGEIDKVVLAQGLIQKHENGENLKN